MGESIEAMGSSLMANSPTHCIDEFPTGYSSAGWSPPEPACASPAQLIVPEIADVLTEKTTNIKYNDNCSGNNLSHPKGSLHFLAFQRHERMSGSPPPFFSLA